MGSDSGCLSKALTAWGWFFDIFTALISLTDVVSDILVAIQFHAAGETVWAGLVIASLALSNIVYSVFVVENLIRSKGYFGGKYCCCLSRDSHCVTRILQYMWVFPLAQLFPVITLIVERACPRDWQMYSAKQAEDRWKAPGGGGEPIEDASDDSESVFDVSMVYLSRSEREKKRAAALEVKRSDRKKIARGLGGAAVGNELGTGSANRLLMERLDKAWIEHMNTHMLFYIETIVESIPQSIIQLLAITFLGQATTLQVFSMSLSLISIVSKGYVVSRSADVSVVFFKFLLAAHDLFGLFYIFSTIIALEEPKEALLFGFEGSLEVSHLSHAWLIAVAVGCFIGVVIALLIGLTIFYDHMRYNGCRNARFGKGFVMVAGSILCAVPIAIAGVGTQLLWVVALIAKTEPSPAEFPATASLYQFVVGSTSDTEERDARTRHFYQNFLGEGGNKDLNPNNHYMKVDEWFRELRDINANHAVPVKGPLQAWFRERWVRLGWTVCSGHCLQRIAKAACNFGIGCYVILQIFTLAFPFISYGMGFHHQNLLQHFCFIAMAFFTFLALLLIPTTWRYFVFLQQFCYPLGWMGSFIHKRLHVWVATYHEPPFAQLVRMEIPGSIIPMDLVDHCCKFMTPQDVDMSSMSLEECKALRRHLIEHEDERLHLAELSRAHQVDVKKNKREAAAKRLRDYCDCYPEVERQFGFDRLLEQMGDDIDSSMAGLEGVYGLEPHKLLRHADDGGVRGLDTFELKDDSSSVGSGCRYLPPATAGGGGGGRHANSGLDHLTRLTAFYTLHNPEELENVEEVLENWEGREEEMFQVFVQAYGPEPLIPQDCPVFIRSSSSGSEVGEEGKQEGEQRPDDEVEMHQVAGGARSQPVDSQSDSDDHSADLSSNKK